MPAVRSALESLTNLPTAADRAELLARARDEGWLPFPLAPLLTRLAEQRTSAEAIILHTPAFFEASYRFLAALVVPVVIRHGTIPPELGSLVGALLGAVPPGVVSAPAHLSLGGYKDLFVEGLRAALAQRATLEHLPDPLRGYLAPASFRLLNRVHSDFVCVRNAISHHDLVGTVGAPLVAEALERATLWWVSQLQPLRDYRVVVSTPAAVVGPDGVLSPLQGSELPTGTRRHAAMLVRWDAFGQVRDAFQLPPFVSFEVDDSVARCRFLAPARPEAGETFGAVGVGEAGPEELSAFTRHEVAELVQIVSRRGIRDAEGRIETWSVALNRAFAGFARCLAVLPDAPEPFELGAYDPPPSVAQRARELRDAGLAVNDLHAIVDGGLAGNFGSDSPVFERTDFAVVKALREAGASPALLSAQAVIVSSTRPELLVHFRSPTSATYPSCFHTIGGAFQPTNGFAGDVSLEDTMYREVQEETQIRPIPASWPVVAAEETTTGFIQYVFLGVCTPTERARGNWEGTLRWLTFDGLEHELTRNPRWVPSGKLHLLLWLAAGAPGARGARFGAHDAHGLLRVVLEQFERDGTLPFQRDPTG